MYGRLRFGSFLNDQVVQNTAYCVIILVHCFTIDLELNIIYGYFRNFVLAFDVTSVKKAQKQVF